MQSCAVLQLQEYLSVTTKRCWRLTEELWLEISHSLALQFDLHSDPCPLSTFICATFWKQQMFSGCTEAHFISHRAVAEVLPWWPWKETTPSQHKVSSWLTHALTPQMKDSSQHQEWVKCLNGCWSTRVALMHVLLAAQKKGPPTR